MTPWIRFSYLNHHRHHIYILGFLITYLSYLDFHLFGWALRCLILKLTSFICTRKIGKRKKKIGKEFEILAKEFRNYASPKDDWKKTLTGLKNEDKSMHATNKMKVQLRTH